MESQKYLRYLYNGSCLDQILVETPTGLLLITLYDPSPYYVGSIGWYTKRMLQDMDFRELTQNEMLELQLITLEEIEELKARII
jgi:hypothetical protein